MKKDNRNVFSYVSAGFQGGVRILVLAVASLLLNKTEMPLFSSIFALVSAIVMLVGSGTSIAVFKLLAKSDNKENKILNVIAFFLPWGGGASFLVVLASSFFLENISIIESSVLVFLISIYQIVRSYIVFEKMFVLLTAIDLIQFLLWLVVILLFYFFCEMSVMILFDAMIFSYIASILLFFIIIHKKMGRVCVRCIVDIDLIKLSSIIGVSSFFSSGISYTLPTMFYSVGGGEYVTMMSFANMVFAAVSVVPRAMINNNISFISNHLQSKSLDKIFLNELNRKVYFVILLGLLLLLIGIIPVFSIAGYISNLLSVEVLFLILFSASLASAQIGVVEANIMNISGKELVALFSNVFGAVSVYLFFFLGGERNIDKLIILVPTYMILFYVARIILYKCIVREFLRD